MCTSPLTSIKLKNLCEDLIRLYTDLKINCANPYSDAYVYFLLHSSAVANSLHLIRFIAEKQLLCFAFFLLASLSRKFPGRNPSTWVSISRLP